MSAVLMIDGVHQTFFNGENLYLNDDYVGQTAFSISQTDMSFTVTDFAKLLGGSAALRDTVAYSNGSNNFSTTGETLTILTTGGTAAVSPEPSSVALLGTGLLGLAGMLRKRYL